jgi:hypothetical protein
MCVDFRDSPYYVKFFYPLDEVKASQMKNDKLVNIENMDQLVIFHLRELSLSPKGQKNLT